MQNFSINNSEKGDTKVKTSNSTTEDAEGNATYKIFVLETDITNVDQI